MRWRCRNLSLFIMATGRSPSFFSVFFFNFSFFFFWGCDLFLFVSSTGRVDENNVCSRVFFFLLRRLFGLTCQNVEPLVLYSYTA